MEETDEDDTSKDEAQGAEPDIMRRRRENMERNRLMAAGLGVGVGHACVSNVLQEPPGASPQPETSQGAAKIGVQPPSPERDWHAAVAAVCNNWPGREGEIALLADMIGLSSDFAAPLFVHGPPATGKTGILHDLLSHSGCAVAHVNCLELMSVSGGHTLSTPSTLPFRTLFGGILSQIAGGLGIASKALSTGGLLARVERHFMVNGAGNDNSAAPGVGADAAERDSDQQAGTSVSEEAAAVNSAEGGRQGSDARQANIACTNWPSFVGQLSVMLHEKARLAAHSMVKVYIVLDSVESLVDSATPGLGPRALTRLLRLPTLIQGHELVTEGGGRSDQKPRGDSQQGGERCTICVCPIIVGRRSGLLSDFARAGSSAAVGRGAGEGSVGQLGSDTLPVSVFFGPYSADTISRILARNPRNFGILAVTEKQRQQVSSFLWTVAQALSLATASLQEIARVASTLWPVYLGEASLPQPKPLHAVLAPYLQRALQGMHEVDNAPNAPLRPDASVTGKPSVPCAGGVRGMASVRSSSRCAIDVGMPRFTQFALVAAFLAGNNPQDADIPLFTPATAGRKRKRRKGKEGGATHESSNKSGEDESHQGQSKGPKPFPLERLLSILTSLLCMQGEMGPRQAEATGSAVLFESLASLAALGLLVRSGSRDELGQPVFRCNIDLTLAEEVAEAAGVPIRQYLLGLHQDR